ncbi:olfactory receptor 56A4-like [Rhinatrema bivittatum]|uniref:olfactory receptor 56A4-like n=1 Tax=Rhinatrema bivittatum TaxID=194408 RepID=UPI00112BFAF6|nr:olfactory receptor 56A4-like [Rhinatrema bivittatum]
MALGLGPGGQDLVFGSGHIIEPGFQPRLKPCQDPASSSNSGHKVSTLDTSSSVTVNSTSSPVSVFLLLCFPGIQSWQHWLSIPLALLFLVALVANLTLLITLYTEVSLHEPMYYFLGLLALLDLVLCTATIPKILAIFWFDWKTISPGFCFLQMYIMNAFLAMESSTFLLMAYDRFVAICHPLRYPSIITNGFVAKAAGFIVGRSSLLTLPVPVLAALLHYCSRDAIAHCICTNVAVTTLACSDRTINSIYQLVIGWSLLGSDLVLIIFSYGFILRAVLRLQAEGAAVKALSTCSSHLILIAFFYSVLLVLIFTNKMQNQMSPDIPILLNVLHHLVPPTLNPIVYGVRTKEIKRGILRVYGISKLAA